MSSTDRWHVYASYSVARVNSKLTADTAGILRTSEIHFWPNTLVISARLLLLGSRTSLRRGTFPA